MGGKTPNQFVASAGNNQVVRFDGATGVPEGVFAQGGGLDGPSFLTFRPAPAVPEPSPLILIGTGVAGLLAFRRRRVAR